LSGTVHVVPFSEVTTVSNFMRDYGYHVASIGVAYKENIDVVKAAIGRAFQRLKAVDDQRLILDDIAIDGVTELGDNAVVVRARIKTKPGYQWTIGRQFTEFVKVVFDEEGIEIPFPHLTLATAIDKIGAPLLTIADNRTEKKENFSAKPQPKRRKDGKDSIDDRES
jgi:small conductance mechanosensitive channel